MKKALIYCAMCVAIGCCVCISHLWMYKHKQPEQQHVDVEEIPEEIHIVNVSDVSKVIDVIDDATDISIQYSHSLKLDGVDNEIDYVGSSYNYQYQQGHVTSIHPEETIDCWYDEDSFMISLDDENFTSNSYADVRDREARYLDTNIQTIKMIVDSLQHSTDTVVTTLSDCTKYRLVTYEGTCGTELLHVTPKAGIDNVVWFLSVPNDTSGEYVARLIITPAKNDQNIELETFTYTFRTNTGFICDRPDFEHIGEYSDGYLHSDGGAKG